MSGFDWIEHPTGESASLWEWRGETGSLWIVRGVGGVLFRKRQTAWWFPIWPSWSLGWKERVLNRNRLARIDIHRAWLERISLQVWKWLFQGHHAKWLELHGLMDRLAEAHCIVLWRFLFRFFPLRVCCCIWELSFSFLLISRYPFDLCYTLSCFHSESPSFHIHWKSPFHPSLTTRCWCLCFSHPLCFLFHIPFLITYSCPQTNQMNIQIIIILPFMQITHLQIHESR